MTVYTTSMRSIYPPRTQGPTTWSDPTAGKVSASNIQDKIDQFASLIPLLPVKDVGIHITRIASAIANSFLDDGAPLPDLLDSGSSEPFEEVDFLTRSIGGKLSIAISALGTIEREQRIDRLKFIVAKSLRRFYSTATIYGGYSNSGWQYYDLWDQSAAFSGLQAICEPTSSSYGLEQGYKASYLNVPLTFTNLNTFIKNFRSANNGEIDYLVMNSQLYDYYLSLFVDGTGKPTVAVPLVVDPLSGRARPAHHGIPILIDDYILTYQQGVDTSTHPEYPGSDTTATSLYAVVLGAEKEGLFGFYPESFGPSPMKIEAVKSSEISDVVYIRGNIEVGLAVQTTRAVGRLPGITFP